MAAWSTVDMATALNSSNEAPASKAPAEFSDSLMSPQAHGWAAPTPYDYNKYSKSGKELADAGLRFDEDALRNLEHRWAHNAPLYEYKEEYGEVGPRLPDLEKILYGARSMDRKTSQGQHWDAIMKILVMQEGPIKIEPSKRFEAAGLHPAMLENVMFCGYSVPTPIQQYTLPAIFNGYDLIACAQTGSGKTAAFLIPILSKFMGKAKLLAAPRPNPAFHDPTRDGQVRAEPLVLIVCPTRELATQIFDEARKLCYRTMLRPVVIYGGTPLFEQILQLGKGADVLIATPGRLIDLLDRPQILSLRRLRYMVIDEADEMLHSDWESDFKRIMTGGDQEPDNITYLMFSATFPKSVRDLAKEYLNGDHVRIRVGRIGSSHENIKQDVIYVEPSMKKAALYDLLMSKPPARTLIFVNSKRAADDLDDFLFNKGMPCTSIHGDRTQREREDSIRAFRKGICPILIATAVSARGIDVPCIAHVINFDLPSFQHGGIEEYTHRIGRTGRSGQIGTATSFYGPKDEDLAKALTQTLCETHQAVPDFLEEFIPDGFTADGQGDATKLHFDADSENGEEDGENGDAVDGWGASGDNTTEAAPAWGVDTSADAATEVDPAFGEPLTRISAPRTIAPNGMANLAMKPPGAPLRCGFQLTSPEVVFQPGMTDTAAEHTIVPPQSPSLANARFGSPLTVDAPAPLPLLTAPATHAVHWASMTNLAAPLVLPQQIQPTPTAQPWSFPSAVQQIQSTLAPSLRNAGPSQEPWDAPLAAQPVPVVKKSAPAPDPITNDWGNTATIPSSWGTGNTDTWGFGGGNVNW